MRQAERLIITGRKVRIPRMLVTGAEIIDPEEVVGTTFDDDGAEHGRRVRRCLSRSAFTALRKQ